MTTRFRRGRGGVRRGIESIELLLGLPVLLLVVAAGVEYGWLVHRVGQLDHAARLGARRASLADADLASVQTAVDSALSAVGIAGAAIVVEPGAPETLPSGAAVTVRITVDYQNADLLGLSSFMPLPSAIEGVASMLREP